MILSKLAGLLFVATTMTGIASAQEVQCSDKCGGLSTVEQRKCLAKLKAELEAQMKKDMATLIAQLRRDPSTRPAISLLNTAQRTWRTYRTRTCSAEQAMAGEGSLSLVVLDDCLCQETSHRRSQIADDLVGEAQQKKSRRPSP